jgi:hypothetical protein
LVNSQEINLSAIIYNKMVKLHTYQMQTLFDRSLSGQSYPKTPWFLFTGKLKGMVYENNPKTIQELKTVITNAVSSISQHEIWWVFNNIIRCVEKCLQVKKA